MKLIYDLTFECSFCILNYYDIFQVLDLLPDTIIFFCLHLLYQYLGVKVSQHVGHVLPSNFLYKNYKNNQLSAILQTFIHLKIEYVHRGKTPPGGKWTTREKFQCIKI